MYPYLASSLKIMFFYLLSFIFLSTGDSRAFLCKFGPERVLHLIQLSYDHTICDPGEIARLQQAGVDVNKFKILRQVGNSDCTRCIGDYHVKGGYKDIDILR